MEYLSSDGKEARSVLRPSQQKAQRRRDLKRARAAGWWPVGARRISGPLAGANANALRARRIQAAKMGAKAVTKKAVQP
jgi:hypothetical protein